MYTVDLHKIAKRLVRELKLNIDNDAYYLALASNSAKEPIKVTLEDLVKKILIN